MLFAGTPHAFLMAILRANRKLEDRFKRREAFVSINFVRNPWAEKKAKLFLQSLNSPFDVGDSRWQQSHIDSHQLEEVSKSGCLFHLFQQHSTKPTSGSNFLEKTFRHKLALKSFCLQMKIENVERGC